MSTATSSISDINNQLVLLFNMVDNLSDAATHANLSEIRQLIQLTKSTSDKVKKSLVTSLSNTITNTDLVSITDEIRNQCSEAFNFQINFKHKGYPTALINKGRYKNLLISLIKNSMEAGSSFASIQITESYLQIVDNGSGFPAHLIKALCQGQGLTTKLEGSGQGLRSVYEFCQNVGWKVVIVENNSSGAKINILFRKSPPS